MKITRFAAGSYEVTLRNFRFSVESLEKRGRWDIYEISTDAYGGDSFDLLAYFDTKREAVSYLRECHSIPSSLK